MNKKNKSDLVLEGAKLRREKDKIISVEEEKVKLVVFTLSGALYAFYGSEVKEILAQANIFYVPGSPAFIHGVINVRGEIESVINLASFLELSDSGSAVNSRVLLAAGESMRSGVLVDSVEDVLDIPVSAIKPPLSTLSESLRGFIEGEFVHDGKTATLLSVKKIFDRVTS